MSALEVETETFEASEIVTSSSDAADELWDSIDKQSEARAPGKYLALLPEITNAALTFQAGGTLPLIEQIKVIASEKAKGLDVATPRGQAGLKSLAYEIARTRTGIDDAGKRLVAKIKEESKVIDAERKRCREILGELQEAIRKPLTDWENASKARMQAHYDALGEISNLHHNVDGETVETVQLKLEQLGILRSRNWEEFAQAATDNCDAVELALKQRHAALVKARADAAELEQLRAQAAQRAQEDRERQIADEAAEKARLKAEAKARKAAEDTERERQEEANRAAERERQLKVREQRERDARIESERRAEAAAKKAEQDRLDAIEEAKESERRRIKEETDKVTRMAARKAADEENRRTVDTEAMDALVELLGIHGAAAKVLKAIRQGSIPHITINY